jgi:hypothetical protein
MKTNGFHIPKGAPPPAQPRGRSNATVLKPIGSPPGRQSAAGTSVQDEPEDSLARTIVAAAIGSAIGSVIGLSLVALFLWFVVM